MALIFPRRYLGPILRLSLPKYEKAINLVLTNVTTGNAMTIEVPALAAALVVTLDFSAKTVLDDDGGDRSSWISATDKELWTSEPLIEGANDIQVEAFDAAEGVGKSTATAYPSSVVNDATVGTVAWSEPERAKSDDGLYASAKVGAGDSQYLKALGFGFSDLPAGATPKGIEVLVRGTRLDDPVTDNGVHLVRGGTIQATDKSNTEPWEGSEGPGSWSIRAYGGKADLWGLAWSVAQLTAANFGFVIGVSGEGGGRHESRAWVDSIGAKVFYEYLPAATAYGATTNISWRTAYV